MAHINVLILQNRNKIIKQIFYESSACALIVTSFERQLAESPGPTDSARFIHTS